MLTIRLFCAAGMSTSLLVRKMIEAAEAEGTEVDIIAYPVGEFDQHITGIDCALLGPQVGYMKAQMQAKAKAAGVPCDVQGRRRPLRRHPHGRLRHGQRQERPGLRQEAHRLSFALFESASSGHMQTRGLHTGRVRV